MGVVGSFWGLWERPPGRGKRNRKLKLGHFHFKLIRPYLRVGESDDKFVYSLSAMNACFQSQSLTV